MGLIVVPLPDESLPPLGDGGVKAANPWAWGGAPANKENHQLIIFGIIT